MKKGLTVLVAVAVVAVCGWFFLFRPNHTSSTNTIHTSETFNKRQFSLTDPSSIWAITNKHRQLSPKDYAPAELIAPDIPLRLTAKDDEMKVRPEAAHALKELYGGAKQAGLELMVSSAYRAYNFQTGLYNRYVQQQGRATADTQSARPGYSEHQTGLAIDIEPASRACEVEVCFANTPEGQWVAAHAHAYGFIVRYPEDKQQITGYIYEPWHLRYVGKALATELHEQGGSPTLEEYFGLEAAPDYL